MRIYIFSAARSFALRLRLFPSTSSLSGRIGFLVRILISPCCFKFLKKFFTILSSIEWYEITTTRPCFEITLSAPVSPLCKTSISLLAAIRKA